MASCLRAHEAEKCLMDRLPQAGRPFLGICLGLQVLYQGSEENGGVEGLGILPGQVTRFPAAHGLPVPHIGWNTLEQRSAPAGMSCLQLWPAHCSARGQYWDKAHTTAVQRAHHLLVLLRNCAAGALHHRGLHACAGALAIFCRG